MSKKSFKLSASLEMLQERPVGLGQATHSTEVVTGRCKLPHYYAATKKQPLMEGMKFVPIM